MKVKKCWGRARLMGGDNFMVFSWHETEEKCNTEIARRKAELNSPVNFVAIYFPNREEEDTD